MTQDLAGLASKVLGSNGRHGPRAHVRDGGGVDDGQGHAGPRVEEIEDGEFRRETPTCSC